MSALGQKRKVGLMSALPPKADIAERDRGTKRDVCFWHKSESCGGNCSSNQFARRDRPPALTLVTLSRGGSSDEFSARSRSGTFF
jgi:hypothetical protein